jgi:hypothetical protein
MGVTRLRGARTSPTIRQRLARAPDPTQEETRMSTQHQRRTLVAAAAASLFALSAAALAADVKVSLSGGEEVPAVTTNAKGSGTITVNDDKSVSGSIQTSGINANAAHIHMGAAGKNGGVIIPLTKNGDTWSVPAGTKLTDAQYDAFKKGDLYVNVHSQQHPAGEIRAQLKP